MAALASHVLLYETRARLCVTHQDHPHRGENGDAVDMKGIVIHYTHERWVASGAATEGVSLTANSIGRARDPPTLLWTI